jgi:hypothetical protein
MAARTKTTATARATAKGKGNSNSKGKGNGNCNCNGNGNGNGNNKSNGNILGRSGCAFTPAFGRAVAPSAHGFLAGLKPCPSDFGLLQS